MRFMVPLTMFGWIPVVLALFAFMPVRRAIITAFLVAWLFLPEAGYVLPSMPDYTKSSATAIGVLLGVFIFDFSRFAMFRPSWIDIPMAIWCMCPFLTALSTGVHPLTGMNHSADHVLNWAIPWVIGRIYFSDAEGLKQLAIGLIVGGLIYLPFVLWELRMSPNLHQKVYGFRQHSPVQTRRGGGYRPMVFLQHGLALSLFMASTALSAFWLWRSRVIKKVWGVPVGWVAAMLTATTVACKSLNAVALLGIAMGALVLSRMMRRSIILFCLLGLPSGYMLARTVGGWSGEAFLELVGQFSTERRNSLMTRVRAENILVPNTMQKAPILGIGAGRFLKDETGQRFEAIPDAYWVIVFGKFGLLGLVVWLSVLLLPPALLLYRVPPKHLGEKLAPAVVLSVSSAMFVCDSLFNAMYNPIFILPVGGIAGLVVSNHLLGRGAAAQTAAPPPQGWPVREMVLTAKPMASKGATVPGKGLAGRSYPY